MFQAHTGYVSSEAFRASNHAVRPYIWTFLGVRAAEASLDAARPRWTPQDLAGRRMSSYNAARVGEAHFEVGFGRLCQRCQRG
jgi:hypothetical protein